MHTHSPTSRWFSLRAFTNNNVIMNISEKFVIVDDAHSVTSNWFVFCFWQSVQAEGMRKRVMSRSLYIDINKNFISFVNTFGLLCREQNSIFSPLRSYSIFHQIVFHRFYRTALSITPLWTNISSFVYDNFVLRFFPCFLFVRCF